MREEIEVRIDEDDARLYLASDEGEVLGGTVQKVIFTPGSPLARKIENLHRRMYIEQGEPFFLGWEIRRSYTEQELGQAEFLHLIPTSFFEPAGEECGTEYDESSACPICGAGRTQVSELVLDLRRAPKKDVVSTIADELIVTSAVADALADADLTGVDLRPVRDRRGRNELEKAWRQLSLENAERVVLDERTRVGDDPAWEGPPDAYRCPLGHTIGLNLLSEVFVDRQSADLAVSDKLIGVWRGLLRPSPVLLISQALYRALQVCKAKGFRAEPVHLV